ncbi:MAG: histidine ammonia-lyase [Alphaproteobacteria bacterium]
MHEITLTGDRLTLAELYAAGQTALDAKARLKITISDDAKKQVKAAEDYLRRMVESGETIYSINTGFGFFVNTRIEPEQMAQLQTNIIRSHACGAGEELPRDVVMMLWLILINSACRGHRGIALEKLERICAMLSAGILSCVPSRGSVGASGDLAPTAHAVLATLGEGECTVPAGDGFARMNAGEALKKAKIEPIALGPKEGLCLINGTQLTAALASKIWCEVDKLLTTANMAAAMSIEGLRASHHMTEDVLLKEQRQEGTLVCGREIAGWLGDTEISKSHTDCGRVQDPYSFRCAPQVHGMVWEELTHSKKILENEINSTSDNPILFPEQDMVIHGGNFHAIYPARVADHLGAALTTLAAISERRVNITMNHEKSGLPTFLIEKGGLNSGFMMVQVTAAALVAECRSLCMPASVDSIPTNNDQEDHVSMGPGAGLKALEIVKHAHYVLAIELLVAAQALDMVGLKTSAKLEKVKAEIRKVATYLAEDRFLNPDIEAVHGLVRDNLLSPTGGED